LEEECPVNTGKILPSRMLWLVRDGSHFHYASIPDIPPESHNDAVPAAGSETPTFM